MNKIPCIKCTPELWEYIEPYLEKWGYTFKYITEKNWKDFPVLVINIASDLGLCGNIDSYSECYDRELTNNVEEFLEQAAKLKGFIYERKDIMKFNGIEIKPGIVIETLEDNKRIFYVVFPLLDGELGVVSYNKISWSNINYFIEKYSSKIVCIYNLTSERLGGLNSGKVLWEEPKEVVITMKDIAEKFKCRVEQVRIKE